jgi:hypothetical protein
MPLYDAMDYLHHQNSRQHKLLDSTAGCGKPHVRWCGRGNGRNPVAPTRSQQGDQHVQRYAWENVAAELERLFITELAK